MRLNNKLDQTIARRLEQLPIARKTTTKALNFLFKESLCWDPWILRDGDIYRLFYLQGPKDGPSMWWTEATIYGATSRDLNHWESSGVVLAPEPSNAWEAGRMLAGSAYKEDGVYYLFYSAAAAGSEIMNEAIGLATSTDGVHWHRYTKQPLVKPGANHPWYGSFYSHVLSGEGVWHFQWRDPYVVRDEKTGRYFMFLCAFLSQGVHERFRGCIGLAVADKITGPYEILPPAAVPMIEGTNEAIFYELERPQVIYRNDQYHLFFSCWKQGVNPKWLEKIGTEKISDSSLYWYVADDIAGPFRPVGEVPVCPGSEKTGMYGTNFLTIPGQPNDLIVYGWYSRLVSLGISPTARARWHHDSLTIHSL
jgi:beta-fructofuranosidase